MRHSRIQIFSKTIRNTSLKAVGRICFGIDRNISETAERTQIVQPSYVIIMLVCDQYGINRTVIIHADHLFTEIRTAVYQDTHSIHFYHSRTTQAVVTRIFTGTHLTPAAHLRDSG